MAVDLLGKEGHARHFLHDHRMINRLRRVFSPGKGSMTAADDGGNMNRVHSPLPERLRDDFAGVGLIVLFNFLRRQTPGAGDGAIEIIGVGGAISGDIPASLRPAYGIRAVGMDNAAQFGKGVVQDQVGFGIGRRCSLPSA